MVILGTTSVMINNWKASLFTLNTLKSLFRAKKTYRIIQAQERKIEKTVKDGISSTNECKLSLSEMVKQFPFLDDKRLNKSNNNRINLTWMKHYMLVITKKCNAYSVECSNAVSNIVKSLE